MIDQFWIFERGGVVLWSRHFVPVKGDPVAVLVRSVLLEDRLSIPELAVDSYTIRWQIDNLRGIVFAVSFQRQLPPAYADDLLTLVRQHFARVEVPTSDALDPVADFSHFSPTFDKLLNTAEKQADAAKRASRALPKRNGKVKHVEGGQKPTVSPEPDTTANSAESGADTLRNVDHAVETISPEERLRQRREAFLNRRGRGKKGGTGRGRVKASVSDVTSSEPAPRKKFMRPSKPSSFNANNLDFSEGKPTDDDLEDAQARRFREQYLDADQNTAFDDVLVSDEEGDDDDDNDNDDDDDTDVDSDSESNSGPSGKAAGLFNFFKGLAGMRSLTQEDLKPAMDQFRDALIGKNVAKDIADKVMESVSASLEGKTMESMTSVSSMVRKSLDEALTRILTPRQSTDILSEIAAKKGTGQPYVITYCGVNGVGKSTSLAKTCYYLLNHGHKVMIAACDTFRAGAVEQLRTHVRCLGKGVELFDRGYGKDAAAVAADAIRQARVLEYDVVLVDTAGRMQDNEPLMRALSKLVEVNRPDRLFFVGEALVGNDAVDQLTKFNAALTDHQSGGNPRLIDGIVLTKFDTIDDKVGAAVSMVYTTGQPIVFIGIGQTYMDLRKLNTRSLVRALLK